MAPVGPMNLPGAVKSALIPGSIPFLLLCLLVWIGLRRFWPRARRVARVWAGVVVVSYLLMAVPSVANAIAGRLPPVPIAEVSSGQIIDTLIVIDGDNRVGRVEKAVHVQRVATVGAIIVLGGAWILGELIDAGVPADRLTRVQGPSTTGGQMEWVRQRIASRPGERIVLIASRLQMPRIAALARAGGIAPLLVLSPIDSEPPSAGLRSLLPSYVALRTSRDALYEHAALVYYRFRRWSD